MVHDMGGVMMGLYIARDEGNSGRFSDTSGQSQLPVLDLPNFRLTQVALLPEIQEVCLKCGYCSHRHFKHRIACLSEYLFEFGAKYGSFSAFHRRCPARSFGVHIYVEWENLPAHLTIFFYFGAICL